MLTDTEKNELAREAIEHRIAVDPLAFIEWLGHDRVDLLASIMGIMQAHADRANGYGPETNRDLVAVHSVNRAIDRYVDIYVAQLLA